MAHGHRAAPCRGRTSLLGVRSRDDSAKEHHPPHPFWGHRGCPCSGHLPATRALAQPSPAHTLPCLPLSQVVSGAPATGTEEGLMLAGSWRGKAGRIRPAGYLGGGRGESTASSGAAVRYPPPLSKNNRLPRHPAHPSPCLHRCPGSLRAGGPSCLSGRIWQGSPAQEQPGRRGRGRVTPDSQPQPGRCHSASSASSATPGRGPDPREPHVPQPHVQKAGAAPLQPTEERQL